MSGFLPNPFLRTTPQQTKLQEFRAKYPGAYDDMPDAELADRLYTKFYAGKLERREFDARIGIKPYENVAEATATAVGNVPERLQMGAAGQSQLVSEAQIDSLDALAAAPPEELANNANFQNWLAERGGQTGDLLAAASNPQLREQFFRMQGTDFAKRSLTAQLDYQRLQSNLEPVDVAKDSAEYYLSGAIGSVAEMAPAFAISILTRNPTPAMAGIGAQVAGTSYADARQRGLQPAEARAYAAMYAAAEAIPEALPLSELLRPGAHFITRLVRGAGAEAVQESVTEALQIGIDKGYLQPDMTWGEATARIKDAAIMGAIAGPLMGAVAHPAGAAMDAAAPLYEKGRDAVRQWFGITTRTGDPKPETMTQLDRVNAGLKRRGYAPIGQAEPIVPTAQPAPGTAMPAPTEPMPQSEPQPAPAPSAAPQEGNQGSVVDRIAMIESAGDPTARNPNSSAGGLGQFIDSTWIATVRAHAPELSGESDAAILARKTDGSPEGVAFQRRMLEAFTSDNAAGLQAAGIEPTPGNTYLAHFLGLGGATTALAADPAADVRAVLGNEVVDANPFLEGMTIADLQRWADGKMSGAKPFAITPGRGVASPAGAVTAEPNAVQPIGQAEPIAAAPAAQPAADVAPPVAIPTPVQMPIAPVTAPAVTPPPTVGKEAIAPAAPTAAPAVDAAPVGVTPAQQADPLPAVEAPQAAPITTPSAPAKITTPEQIEQVRAEVNTDPTPAQAEAGNYKKGHVVYQGHNITIETPRGALRRGTDASGKPWSVAMPADYGYIKRTTGADGDHVDVYLGPNPDAKKVFVVDQLDAESGAFDEHKVIMGVDTVAEARLLYAAAFSDGKGKQRLGAITGISQANFKDWLANGDTSKPFATLKGKAKAPAPAVPTTPAAAPAQTEFQPAEPGDLMSNQGHEQKEPDPASRQKDGKTQVWARKWESGEERRYHLLFKTPMGRGDAAVMAPTIEQAARLIMRSRKVSTITVMKRYQEGRPISEAEQIDRDFELVPSPQESVEAQQQTAGNVRLTVENDRAIGNYKPMEEGLVVLGRRGETRGDAARKTVVARGRASESRKEFLIAFDATGQLIANGEGSESFVGFSPALEEAKRYYGARIVAHHNHPSGSSFSGGDMAGMLLPGIETLWAHANVGDVSYRGAIPEAVKREIFERRNKAEDALIRRHSDARDRVAAWLFTAESEVINRERGRVVAHIVAMAWNRAGVLDYQTNYELPAEIVERMGYEELLKELEHGFKNFAFGPAGGRTNSIDRPTGRVGHPGDVGTTPWQRDEAAEDGPTAQADDRAGAKSDPRERGVEVGQRMTVTTPTGQKIEVQPVIIDAEILGKATGDLQPRDRSRAASDAQIEDIAIKLDPDRLLPSREADRGAPIIGPDNVVESGNGRRMAILRASRAYQRKYLDYVKAMEAAGYEFPAMEGTPILALRRITPLTHEERVEFVNAANTSAIARMSATEQAAADARLITPDVIATIDQGATISPEYLSASSNKLTKAFLNKLSQSERASLVDAGGSINTDGVRRIQNALLAAAYGDSAMLAKAAEAVDNNAKAITGAMIDVAGDWAAMRADISSADVDASYDLTPRLLSAVQLLERARATAAERGTKVKDEINLAVNQIDMLSGAVETVAADFIEAFYTPGFGAAKSRAKIAEFLRSITVETASVIQPQLLGGTPTPEEVMQAARRKQERDENAQGDIFAARNPGGRARTDGQEDGRRGVPSASNQDQRGDRAEAGAERLEGGVGAVSSSAPADAGERAGAESENRAGETDDSGEGNLTPADIAALGVDGPMPKYVGMYANIGVPQRPTDDKLTINGRTIDIPPLDKPQRREGVRTLVQDIIGARLYAGKVKGKSRLGFYRRSNSEVRTRSYDDVEVMAHEMAHYLDFHYGTKAQFSSKALPRALKAEVKQLSYTSDPAVVVSEGFAEFVRLWLTNHAAAKAAAPQFTAHFEKMLAADTRLRKKMERLQDAAHRWFYQGTHAQLRAKSGEEYTPYEQIVRFQQSYPAERLRAEIIDKIHGANVVERTLKGTIQDATKSAYKQFQMVNGAESVHEAVVKDGTVGIDTDGTLVKTGPGLTEILFPVAKKGWKQFDLLMDYFKARRGAELRTQGREHLFTPAEIEAGLSLAVKHPEFPKVFDAFQAFNQRMLDFYESAGLITAKMREQFEDANRSYVPFHRVGRIIEQGNRAQGSTALGKRLSGGSQNTRDIAENIIEGLFSNVRAALIARAKATLYRDILRSQDGSLFAVKLGTDSKKVTAHIADMARTVASAMVELGIGVSNNGRIVNQGQVDGAIYDMEEIASILERNPDLLDFWMLNQPPKTDGDTFVDSAILNGERVYFEVREPLLVDMLTGMRGLSSGFVLRQLYRIKNFQTRTVTSMLQFLGPNAWRDTVSAAILSKNSFVPVVDTFVGMAHVAMKSPAYLEMRRQGGGYGTRIEARTEETRSRRALDLPARNGWDVAARLLAGYDHFSSAFEYGSRMGDYLKARKGGKNALQAAWEAREITTDFSKIGRNEFWAKFIRTVPFMNAGIQGIDKTARELAQIDGKMTVANLARFNSAKAKFMLKGAVITAMTTILWLLNKDDDRYKQLTEDERARFWWIFAPGLDKPIKIPRPYDIGYLFASLPETLLNFINDKDGEAAAKQVAWIAANTMPVGDYPGIFQPWMEVQTNKTFTGAPVVPFNMVDMPPRYQFNERTPQMYVALGQALNISPLVAEHYAQGYLRYVEQYLSDATEAAFWNTEKWGERPFVKGGPVDYLTYQFVGRRVPFRTKWTEGYFDLKQRAAGMRSAFSNLQALAIKDGTQLQQLAADKYAMTLQALDSTFAGIDAAFADQDEFLSSVKYNPRLTAAEKETQIDNYYRQKNEALATAYQQISAALDEVEEGMRP